MKANSQGRKDSIRIITEDENVKELCDLKISNSFVVLLTKKIKKLPQETKREKIHPETESYGSSNL